MGWDNIMKVVDPIGYNMHKQEPKKMQKVDPIQSSIFRRTGTVDRRDTPAKNTFSKKYSWQK